MFAVNWREDSSAEVLGRITARNGSGAFTGQRGEGKFIQQADVETITCTHYDLTDDPDKENPTDIPVDPVTVIMDVPDSSGYSWKKDTIGFNFAHHLLPVNFPEGDHVYRIEYRFELVGGFVFHESFQGPSGKIDKT